jgi:hypothetical protein
MVTLEPAAYFRRRAEEFRERAAALPEGSRREPLMELAEIFEQRAVEAERSARQDETKQSRYPSLQAAHD